MKMSRKELRVFFTKLVALLNSEEELTFKIIHAVTKVKNQIKTEVEEINEMLTSMQRNETKLAVKWCFKDKDGKPVIKDDRYCGLETGVNAEYDDAVNTCIEGRKAYMKEEVDVEMHYINKEDMPKKGPANVLEALCYFIEEPDEQ